MKKTICLSLVLIAVLATSGCSLYGNNQTSAPRTVPVTAQPATTDDNSGVANPTATPPATPENKSAAINIENFSFNPNTTTIKKGATITWTNNDSAPHQIKSATFNSGVLSQGQAFSFTFNDAGAFSYSCSIHPAMIGQIIIQ